MAEPMPASTGPQLASTDSGQEARKAIFNAAVKNAPLFEPKRKQLARSWNTLFSCWFLGPGAYAEQTDSEIEAEIRARWTGFVEGDLPQIRDRVRDAFGAS